MHRAVSFDLDGTLADTIPVCVRAFRTAILAHGGPDLSPGEVVARFGPSEEGILRGLLGSRWRAGYETFLTEFERIHGECSAPFAGIPELIGELRARGVRLAVVTGKGPDTAAISLRELGLDRAFEVVEAGSATGAIKDDSLRRVLLRFGVDGAELVHVGDSPVDVRAARAAGVGSVAAAWAASADRTALAAEGPDLVCGSVAELARYLLGDLTAPTRP